MPELGRFFNIDPLAEKYVHNSTYAFSENKVTNNIELEGLEAASPEYMFNKAGQPVMGVANNATESINQAIDKTGQAIETGAVATYDGAKSALNWVGSKIDGWLDGTEGGFTLTSEKGGVKGGTDEHVREGQSSRLLEVGNLLTPDTRNDAVNLVQGIEEETNVIENTVKKLSVGDTISNGNEQPAGTIGYGQGDSNKLSPDQRVENQWESIGDGNWILKKSDTTKNQN